MAKHYYDIPLKKTLEFINSFKSDINEIVKDKKLRYKNSIFGKSYYILEIEKFINFFKIDKDLDNSLKVIEYLNSFVFFEEIFKALSLDRFKEFNKSEKKEFLYAFCFVLYKKDRGLFEHFWQKSFLHYYSTLNKSSNITINYKDICFALAKNRNLELKESFGEKEKEAFFKIFVDGKEMVSLKGKSIKVLRKRAYRELLKSGI